MQRSDHKEFYRKHLTFLTENIRVSQILSGLFTQQLISARDREELSRLCDRSGDIAAADKLIMEILWRNPDRKSIYKLINVLKQQSHREVAEYIEEYFPDIRQEETPVTSGAYYQYQNQPVTSQDSCISANPASSTNPGAQLAAATSDRQFVQVEHFADHIPVTTKPDHKHNQDQLFGFTKQMAKFVCMLEYPGGYATAFILGSIPYTSEGQTKQHFVILTNNHVLDVVLAKQYLNDDPELCTVAAMFHMDPDNTNYVHKVLLKSVVLSNDKSLDYAMLMLHYDQVLLDTFECDNRLAKFIPSSDIRPSHQDVLVLIGHPMGHVKTIDHATVIDQQTISIQNNDHRVFYDCCSFHGSSGSPCIDAKAKKLYCMQCGDIPVAPNRRVEHGVVLYHVVKDIQNKLYSGSLRGQLYEEQFLALFPAFKQLS